MTPSPFDYGLAGAAFALVWKVLDMVKIQWMQRQGYSGNDDITHTHILNVAKDAQRRVKRWDDMIGPHAEGPFACAWSRDEVIKLTSAMESLSTEMRLLREEIQRDRQARKNGS